MADHISTPDVEYREVNSEATSVTAQIPFAVNQVVSYRQHVNAVDVNSQQLTGSTTVP